MVLPWPRQAMTSLLLCFIFGIDNNLMFGEINELIRRSWLSQDNKNNECLSSAFPKIFS